MSRRELMVYDLIDKWKPRLGLQAWDIRYNPERIVNEASLADNTNTTVMMVCEIGIQQDCPDSELEGCVLHELVHLVINPLGDRAMSLVGAIADERIGIMLLEEIDEQIEGIIEQVVTGLTGRRPLPFGKGMVKHFSTFMDDAA